VTIDRQRATLVKGPTAEALHALGSVEADKMFLPKGVRACA